VQALGQARGHSWRHHIVQQMNIDRFGPKRIHNTCNVIMLPNDVHQEITSVQRSKDFFITGNYTQTVQQWISQFSYEQQWNFGRALVEYTLTGKWPTGYKFPRK
jgi:hypothetical protein